jgi:hypothetical protein
MSLPVRAQNRAKNQLSLDFCTTFVIRPRARVKDSVINSRSFSTVEQIFAAKLRNSA